MSSGFDMKLNIHTEVNMNYEINLVSEFSNLYINVIHTGITRYVCVHLHIQCMYNIKSITPKLKVVLDFIMIKANIRS